jgi:hypothetical protein
MAIRCFCSLGDKNNYSELSIIRAKGKSKTKIIRTLYFIVFSYTQTEKRDLLTHTPHSLCARAPRYESYRDEYSVCIFILRNFMNHTLCKLKNELCTDNP